ncbi:alanine racemase [Effusibacillus dendaii]|uniref:Alanine racemase n=1 Tax=Effusibacillus dendaii TaxID=2743772 RepID=A0A7I8DB36_9BACL|nr:alanine racemase [Effusibacillus dendaii]BCJ87217.1 alanine racemase [Effusibacillus dendaii]
MIRPTWAEINLSNIAHNVQEFRRVLPSTTRILAAVKGDGYGHGAIPVAKQAIASGVDYLAVASVEEAIPLREAGIEEPILILGYTPPEAAEQVIRWNLTQTVFQNDLVDALEAAAKRTGTKARVHVKIDTGMGRIGLQAEEAIGFIRDLARREWIELEGVFSHLATADDPDPRYVRSQFSRWERLLQELDDHLIQIPLRHLANSAAAIKFPEMAYDMVRIGISLYGLYPGKQVDRSLIDLRQAMQFVTKIVHLKMLPRGAGVSYGATPVEREQALIATLPVGYADGYSRLLSNKSSVLVRGQRAPIIGRICMDQCMIDVTDIKGVSVGDQVVLYGEQGDEFISLDEIADLIGTISYEVACDLGKRVPRLYRFE